MSLFVGTAKLPAKKEIKELNLLFGAENGSVKKKKNNNNSQQSEDRFSVLLSEGTFLPQPPLPSSSSFFQPPSGDSSSDDDDDDDTLDDDVWGARLSQRVSVILGDGAQSKLPFMRELHRASKVISKSQNPAHHQNQQDKTTALRKATTSPVPNRLPLTSTALPSQKMGVALSPSSSPLHKSSARLKTNPVSVNFGASPLPLPSLPPSTTTSGGSSPIQSPLHSPLHSPALPSFPRSTSPASPSSSGELPKLPVDVVKPSPKPRPPTAVRKPLILPDGNPNPSFEEVQALHLKSDSKEQEQLVKTPSSSSVEEKKKTPRREPTKEEMVKAAITIQRQFRHWRLFKHLHRTVALYRVRSHVCKEILSTEVTYVSALRFLIHKYCEPITQELSNLNIEIEDVRVIFGGVEVLMNINKNLLSSLKERMAKFSSDTCFGDVFLSLTPFLKCYSDYVKNFDTAMRRIDDCLKKSPKFAHYLKSSEEEGLRHTLESLLITPVQRIPRYVLLLDQLYKNTPTTHADYQNLGKALALIRSVATYVNEKKREADNALRVVEIQSLLTGRVPTLVAAQRRFVKEGHLTVISRSESKRKQKRFLFLFNDLIILTKPFMQVLIGSKKQKYKFKEFITLYELDVEEGPETILYLRQNGVTHTFVFETTDIRKQWIDPIRSNIQVLKNAEKGFEEKTDKATNDTAKALRSGMTYHATANKQRPTVSDSFFVKAGEEEDVETGEGLKKSESKKDVGSSFIMRKSESKKEIPKEKEKSSSKLSTPLSPRAEKKSSKRMITKESSSDNLKDSSEPAVTLTVQTDLKQQQTDTSPPASPSVNGPEGVISPRLVELAGGVGGGRRNRATIRQDHPLELSGKLSDKVPATGSTKHMFPNANGVTATTGSPTGSPRMTLSSSQIHGGSPSGSPRMTITAAQLSSSPVVSPRMTIVTTPLGLGGSGGLSGSSNSLGAGGGSSNSLGGGGGSSNSLGGGGGSSNSLLGGSSLGVSIGGSGTISAPDSPTTEDPPPPPPTAAEEQELNDIIVSSTDDPEPHTKLIGLLRKFLFFRRLRGRVTTSAPKSGKTDKKYGLAEKKSVTQMVGMKAKMLDELVDTVPKAPTSDSKEGKKQEKLARKKEKEARKQREKDEKKKVKSDKKEEKEKEKEKDKKKGSEIMASPEP